MTGLGLVPISPRAEGLWKGAFPVTQQPLPSRLHGSELCNAAHTTHLLCVNPINISWSCFLQGKGCYRLWLSAAPTSAPLLAENIPFPSTGSQHPAAPPLPSPFCINKYCFAFQGLCIPRGPRVLKSSWVQLKVLTIFCSWSLKPACSRGARCYSPVLRSLGPSHQPCSSRMGNQAHPHPQCPPPPPSSVTSSRMVNVALWQLGASSLNPICLGPIRPAWPHPARSSRLAPEPRGEGRLFAEKVAF